MSYVELERELSSELVEIYLDEAVTRGYLKFDEFDRSCYLVGATNELSADENSPPLALVEQSENVAVENHKSSENLSSSQKPYNLP